MKALRTSAATSPGRAYLTLALAAVLATGAFEVGRTSSTHCESGSGVRPALGVTSMDWPVEEILAPPFRATPPHP